MKLQTQTELSAIVYDWLTNTNNKINKDYCQQEITTHPDYPAMTAVVDFLDLGNMGYQAVQADASYIHEFNYPLIAHIKKPGNEYLHLIKDASVWDKEKSITENWSGIALYANKGATWHNEENNSAKKAAQKNKYISAAFVIAGIGLFITSIFIHAYFAINTFGLLSLTGLAISIAALGTELGYQSKLVKQVCGTVKNGGCEKVLRSKFAKGFAGITPADASVLYFAAQFILYLIGCLYSPLLNCILAIAFAGIVVATWSIYTQAIKLKEWCALCLCIVGVLTGQIIIAFIQFDVSSFSQYEIYFYFALTIALLTMIYLPIKNLIKINTKNQQELNSFKKWKTDASLFYNQIEKEPFCDSTIWENDLLIGNAQSPIRITVACNPYCNPCAEAHFELGNIWKKHRKNICIAVRFLCDPSDETDRRTIVVKSLLQLAKSKNSVDIEHALDDWFQVMDYAKWSIKWQVKNEINVQNDIQKHQQWITESKIRSTPTIFINGRKLPNRYTIKDFEKMIPQIEETFVSFK